MSDAARAIDGSRNSSTGSNEHTESNEQGRTQIVWLMPDGTLTSDRGVAEQGAARARQNRLMSQFVDRMRTNGLDPAKQADIQKQAQLDYEEPMRRAVDIAWNKAEDADKAANDAYDKEVQEHGMTWRDAIASSDANGMHVTPPSTRDIADMRRRVSHKKAFSLAKMTEDALANMPEHYRKEVLDAYTQHFKGDRKKAEAAFRDEISQMLYGRLVERAMPKGTAEFVARKIADGNLVSPEWAAELTASAMADSYDENIARNAAMAQYGKEHRVADIFGTVAGMAADPVTYVSGGVGGAAGKAAMSTVARTMAARSLKGAATDVAKRVAGSTLGGRLAAGMVGGGALAGAYEALKNIQEQMYTGGVADYSTGKRGGYSLGAVLGAAGRGVVLGTAMGSIAPVTGNVADRIVGNVGSTAGKAGVRAAQGVTNVVAEGTVFAMPEWISGDADFVDAWTDGMATALGFKVSHAIKSVPRTIEALRPKKDARGRVTDGMDFEQRLRERLNGAGRGMALTKEDERELRDNGYGGLADLFGGEHVKTNGKVHLVRGKDGTWNMVVRDGEGVKERPEGTTTKEERASAPYAGNVEMDGYDAMRQLMGDGRVSEAARAKCYWILTGRQLPMSTVAGWQTEEHGDGTYTVRSVTAGGDVITSRRFKNKRDAQGEEMKIRRQAEYNTVEVGERYADRRAFEAAAEDVAGEYGTTAEAVRNAAANVEAGKGTAGEQEIYNRYGEALETRRGEMSAEAIRKRIEAENKCSIDAILGKSPDKRTEAEQAVVERYLEELYPEGMSNKSDRSYESTGNAENTENAGGENEQKRLPGGVGDELPFEGPTGPTGPNDTGAPEDANAGRAGNVPTAEAEAARAEAMSAAYEALEEAFGGREDLLADVKDDPWETLRDPELTGEQREAVVQYLNNVTSGSDGNNENNAGSVQPTGMTSEVATATARRINHESGMVVPARIAAIGNAPAEDVYIVSGEVRMQPDGSAIDRGNSDSFIVVCDAEGNYHATSPERLESVGEAVTPEQWAQTLENIRQQAAQAAAAARTQQQATEAAAMRPQFALNDELPPDDIPGNVETAQNNEPVGIPAPTNGAEVTSAEEPLGPEPTPEPTALSRVPTDAKGEPMFEQAEDAATAWDALVEYSGGDVATAKEIAAVMAQEKRKEYERARKLKPKGKTPAEILASKRNIVAEQSRTQLEYERWRQMAEVERGREAAAEREREAAARREAAEQAERERAERAAQAEADRLRLERLNGVPDWRADTPEHARARGYRRSGPEVVERQGAVSAVRGKDVRVKFAKDTTADGVAAVIDVDDLQPSHVQGVRNVRHFIPEAQPKDRKDAVSKVSAQDIAWNIRPEEITGSITAYTGAPSVNARGETIQGNSRADALKWMYDNAPEQAARYKAYLVEHAADFGMDAADIEAVERPVLVNMLDVSDGEAIRLGQYVQADTESGGVERIRGRAAARKIGADMREYAERLLSSGDEDASISQLVAANGVKTLQWMNTRGYITDTQYASCFDRKGELTGNAAEDLKDVLYQGIFEGGSVEIEEMFAKLPARVQRAILATAYRDYDSPEADSIRGEIQQAIVLYNEMMMYPQYAGAMNVESALTAVAAWSQQYAFDEASGESYLPAERFSNFALHLAAMYKGMSQRGLQKMFNNLYDTIQGVGEDTLFESVERTPHTIAEAVKKVLGIDYKPVNERNNGETGNVPMADDSEVGQGGGRGSTTDVGSRERVAGTGRAYERRAGAAAAGAGAGGVGFSEGGGDPVGRSLSEREATELVGRMEAEAEVAPMVELTPENWLAQFGEDGMVDTPIGVVKMGENQFIKMYSRGRAEYFGMVYPTLYTPDVVLEEVDPKDGSERDSKYLFVKTFVEADGARIVHFESVTVKKDGMEVSISSHEIKDTAVKNKMQNDKILHLAEKLSPGSEWRLTETPSGSKRPDLVPASDGTSLRGKDTTKSADVQEKSDNIVGGQETPMSAKIKTASAEVNTDPTEAQKEAGNYKKGHVQVGTFDITIEQPQGSVRKGTDADGKQWESKMNNTYGYIRGAVGVDGDHIDVFLSNDIDGWNGRKVFVVDQYNPDGSFDEHKVMLGFNDQDEAKGDYLANYEQGWENGRRIDITGVNLEDFEKWIESSKRKTKPFGEYSSVKKDVVEINAPEEAGYSITPSTYTNKKGKTSDVSLLTFDYDLTADQERAVKEFAKERIGEGRFAPARGWKDRESGGWVFRSEEDARKAAEMVGNEEAVADNQPMTAQELRDAVEPKKPTASKKTAAKKPANRVEVADVAEQKPSEPTKAEQPKQDGEKKLVITDEMKHDEDILRELLGIGDEELDGGIKFRDPDAMTSQQRRFVYNAGVNYSLGYIDQGFVKFPEFAKAMVSRLGYKIKPWLKSFYEGAKRIPGYDQTMFTPTEEVDAFDVENFDKPNKDVMAQANMIVEEGKAQVAAEKANKELKATRNEQRKETEKQTAANTDAVAAEAKSVASEATALAETSSDEQILTGAAERVDETLDKVNEQLALLGYYEADEVEKDYNEAYGYMRNAEKKAVKDAANLASQLIDDLGLDRFEATHGKEDKKGKRKTKPLAVANIAPAGGDVSIHLPLAEGRELYVNIQLAPSFEKGEIDDRGDNLTTTGIMFRVEGENGYVGENRFLPADVTYSTLLEEIRKHSRWGLSKQDSDRKLREMAEMAERGESPYVVTSDVEKGLARQWAEAEYRPGDKVQYTPDGLKWHNAVVHGVDEDGVLLDAGQAPVLWVSIPLDQLDQMRRPQGKEDIFQQAERVAAEARQKREGTGTDNQGNPVNADGSLKVERVSTISDITDGDFTNPKRNVVLPPLPAKVDGAIGANGKDVVIKKSIFEKNRKSHSDLTPGQSREILTEALYHPDLYGKNQKTSGPYNWILIHNAEKHSSVILEVSHGKDNVEIFNWHYLDDTALRQKERQAVKEGGLILTLESAAGDTQNGLSSGSKDTTKSADVQEKRRKVEPEQPLGGLFAGLFDEPKDNGLQGNDDAVRTEAVPTDRSGQRQGLRGGERTTRKAAAQESGRPDGGREGQSTGKDRAVSAGLHGLTEPKNTRNNHSERGADHAPTSVNGRIEANIKAIELAHQLLESGETATPEQMSVLRQFSGWGGLGAAFSDGGYDWKQRERNKKIRELLGEEAYEQAVMSANSAYYTPAYVVDTLWDIANQLGFKGGNILEGSAGIGNILGQMPTTVSERSNIHAIEIDSTSGGILSLLYPDAKVQIQGFEQTRIPNGSVDLAITNVPFVTGLRVNDTTGDSDLSKKFHNIHDFCIAKNVRKLREGGLGIFISSNGTLDGSKALRDWVVNEGGSDFIGAFRMNNKTFGGTTVTSDIIVIRKRVNGQKSAQAIDVSSISGERTAEYEEPGARKAKQLSMDYNKYFIEHPDHMAGEMRFAFEEGDTFRPTSKGLYPVSGKDQGKMLADFVKSFTEETGGSMATTESAKPYYVSDASADGKKLGELYLKDGKLVTAGLGGYYPIEINDKNIKGHTKQECFNAYAAIKTALAEVMKYQTENEGDAGLQPLIDKLNKVYDTFVSTYGHFTKNNQLAWLRNDVDYPNVFSLEAYKEQGDGKGGVVKTYDKADVMKGRVVEKESEPHPENVKDGVVVSMFKNGRIDVPYIAGQLGKSEEAVKREIIDSGLGFEDPATRQIEVSYQYLSGNVREKLKQAEANNENGEYSKNIKALQEVVPMNIPAHLIDFTLGSSWLDPKLYDEYVKDRTGIDVHFTAAGGTWFMKAPTYGTNVEKNRAMGIVSEMLKKTIMGHELIAAAIQNKSIIVSRTEKHYDGTTETITDREATAACAAKIDEIRQDFKDWARGKMQSDADLSARMEREYNDRFNNYVPMSIPNDFVPEYFGGATHKFKMSPHQGKAIVRGTMQPLLLAHEVGTGKTFTLISTAMEMRRLGTARKPMIVVQNATVGQFAASAKELYPNAKILTLEDNDRNAEGRKNFYAKIKYNDWDMIVVPQSTFEFIPDSDERQMQFVQDKIDEKMLVLEQMRKADDSGRDPITRRAEKELADLQAEMAALSDGISKKRSANNEKKKAVAKQNAAVKAQEMLDRRTDDVENFDDMGIDALLIDEAHEYKHLGFATAMQRGVKGVDPSYSKKSQGVYLKTQAILEKNNGRNVIFATGTPISNTAAEIWTFMRYLMPKDTMKEYGIYYFDDFVRNFGNLQQMMEFSTSGKFKEVNRFAGYVNLPELVRIWSSVADTVLTKDQTELVEKIPEMEGGKAQDIYLPQTRALRSVMKYVRAELDRFDKMSGKEKKANSSIPLTMYGIAQGAAVDARLVEMDAEDDPNSKTNEAVRQTLRSLKETDGYKGTVAIFADHYQNKRSGFNLYEDIKKKLIQQGVPENEVVVMKPGMTIKKKLEIFDKVNRGEVRVVLGSTATLGTGVNIQERLHTLIHLDAPNRPMDYTQRNGRILRQGNLHKDWGKPVRVLRFGVEDSLDVTAYQRLKTKGAIADSVMEGERLMQDSMNNRVLEEEEDAFGDTVAQLSGSEYALLKNNAEKNVRKYESRKKQWEADQTYIHNAKPKLEGQIKNAEQRAEEAKGHLHTVQKAFPNGKFAEIIIGKYKFGTVADMADFIKEYNKKILDAVKAMKENTGTSSQTKTLTLSLGGYDFVVKTEMSRETVNGGGLLLSEVHRKMTYSCPELGLMNVPVKQSLLRNAVEDITENVITGKDFAERLDVAERAAAHGKSELEQLKQREGKPFEFGKELEEAKRQLAEYTEAMKAEMAEKEKKYAEMDASVEAATDIVAEDGDESAEDKTKFRLLEDDDPKAMELESLPESELVPVYRNVQVFEDDALGSPMAFTDAETGERRTLEGRRWNYSAPPKVELTEEQQRKLDELNKNGYIMVDGKKSTELQINDGLKFVKPKTKEAQLQYFLKKNPEDKGLWAAYDPYDHAIETPLNTQFGEAYKRPNLVVVRSLIPKSEIDEPFHADYALLPTGAHQWNNGRTLYLSRWSKIDKVLTREEEAKLIDEYWKKHPGKREELKTHRDYNRFVPQVRRELEKMGYRFELDGKELTPKESLALDKQNWESRDIIPGREGRTPFVSNEDIARINAKMAGKWVGEPKEAMESAMSERVTELSERLHTPVRIIRTEEEVAALPSVRQRRMKGSFNPMTGEVTIVVPNNANMADIENTFVHEVVGHDGLRVLFPDKAKLNNALDELYRVSKDEIRGTIDRMAQKMYDAEVDRIREKKRKEHEANGEDATASYYADMAAAHAEAGKKREQYRRDATEEYGADLAGRIGESGFEKMSAAEQTFWGRLKAMLQKALQRLLDGLKIRSKRQWGDKEWAFVLHEAFKRKRRGGGRPTVFDMADTEVMRRKTGFGEMSNVESYGKNENNKNYESAGATIASMKQRVTELFEKAKTGEFTGKPASIGRLSADGKAFLEKLSGLQFKKFVDFVLNPSDLNHIRADHYGENEKDKGNNVPLTDEDIQSVVDVLNQPDGILYGVEKKDGRKLFFFLKDAGNGLYNLTEVCSTKKGNLTAKSFFKSKKKGIDQRVMEIKRSLLPTSVTYSGEFLSSDAKIPPLFETNNISDENVADNGIKFRDGDDGLGEAIAQMKDAASLANTDNRQAKENAMKAIGGNLSMLRQAMARQRGYDLSTVKSITDLVKRMLENGLLDDLGKAETKRILSAAANVTGREDTSKYVQKVMDIMVDNQLRRSRDALGRLLSIRGKRVDGRGIEVQGALDANGVAVLQAFKKSKGLDWATIDERISDAFNRMSSEDDALAEEATLEYSGLVFARQYVSDITESVSEEKGLREDLRQAKEDHISGRLDDASYRQFVSATEEAIRDNKVERAEAYRELIERLGGELGESAERARQWREAEKVRVGEIHHNANSDMEGRPTDEHHKSTAAEKLANNDLVRFLLAPLATFDQMLRMFGRKNVRGEGYLWNRYMRGWEEATSREYTGYRDALRELDAKVSEVFGKKMSWGDLFTLERHMDGGSVRFWDGGEMKEHKLTQGNLLYIYMVDKMSDGRMKLRHMGITEGDVEAVKALLDPRFVRLADWLQDEFLVKKRNKYNEVHKRMFGTSMAAIENYFPLKILANARTEQIDINDESTTPAQPSTSTGSIIKRRRNKLALDITGADAFSVILDHLQEMERWAAFAEYNRDLNALLSYKRFRNQVLNMNSVYGSGRVLWNNFRDVCRMAAGAYRPPVAKLDKAAVNIAKGVTAAKVNFRVFTALKQLLSMPAYISDCNPVHFAANLANPVKAWKWCMKNLPLFEKRWRSRMAGDPRLLKSEMDWRAWRSRVVEISSRIGMSPNAFVDALTVAIGTRAMYQTKKAKYMRWGMSETAADARAKQDATILFNQTQQSSEGAFLSTLQVDSSWLSVLFTVFRIAAMSYTRQQYDAFRNLGHRLQPGYKSQSLEFMAKQFERDGIEQGNAVKAAHQEYYRGISRDLARVAVFGYILQLAWNLVAYLPYLLLGNDDDEKDAMWEDVWNHTAFGSIEGLTGGDVYSSAGQMWLNGDMKWSQLVKDMPIASDLAGIYSKMGSDKVSAINDVINLLVQSGIGVNPQSLTDAVAAVMDYSNGDADTSREYALMVARVLNCPQSQLDKVYFDELDATAREASMMTPAEIAQRYAEYKALRGAPLTGWMRSEAQQDSVEGRWRKRALTVAREKLDNRVATEKTKMLLGQYDSLNKRKNDIGKLRKGNVEEYRKELRRLYRDNDFRIYYRMQRYKRDIKEQTERYLRTQSTRERDSLVRSMMSTRDRMLQDVEALEDTPQ